MNADSLQMYDPRNLPPDRFLSLMAECGVARDAARSVLGQVISRGVCSPGSWVGSGSISKRIAGRFDELPRLYLERFEISPQDNFQKILFRTGDSLAVETVLIPLHKAGMVSLCLSSQVGCVMGCEFCATARIKSRRNLECWEIVDQFIQARAMVESQGRRVSGVVFMGMGEPFLNYERVMTAAGLFCYPLDRAVSAKAITVSTVGLVREIDRFTEESRPYRLSISLGAATDEKRARLVPVAARTPLKEVIAAARRYTKRRKRRVNLAYVCISGENVGPDDAEALAEQIGDTPVRLDLIDVTDPTGRFRPPDAAELETFRTALCRALRQPVVRRYSGGKDIGAACGTLAAE